MKMSNIKCMQDRALILTSRQGNGTSILVGENLPEDKAEESLST